MNAKHKKAPGVERNAGEERAGGNAHGAHTTTTPGGVKLQKGSPTMDKKNNPAPVGRGHTLAELYRQRKTLAPNPLFIGDFCGFGETTMLYSDPGAGKTNTTYALAVFGSLGRAVLGLSVCPAHGLYLDQEMTKYDELVRQNAICLSSNLPTESVTGFISIVGDEQDEPITFENLPRIMEEEFKARKWDIRKSFLIVDTFAETANLEDENSAKDTIAALKKLRTWIRQNQIALILSHHTNKQGFTFRGSSAILGIIDNMYHLRECSESEHSKWVERCRGDGVESGGRFYVLESDKSRRHFFQSLHLEKYLCPRDDFIPHDPRDNGTTDAFLWVSLGVVGKEDVEAVRRHFEACKDYALEWDSEISGHVAYPIALNDVASNSGCSSSSGKNAKKDKKEKTSILRARMVPLVFPTRVSIFSSERNLIKACVEKFGKGETTWRNAINCAVNDLKLVRNVEGAPLALTDAGIQIWKDGNPSAVGDASA